MPVLNAAQVSPRETSFAFRTKRTDSATMLFMSTDVSLSSTFKRLYSVVSSASEESSPIFCKACRMVIMTVHYSTERRSVTWQRVSQEASIRHGVFEELKYRQD